MRRRNAIEVLTGILVLIVAVGFLGYAIAHSGTGPSGASYQLVANFDNIAGLNVGADVRLAGVKVGSVQAEAIDPKTYLARVTLDIRDGVELPKDSGVSVASESLLGGIYLAISAGGSDQMLKAGEAFTATQGAVSLQDLLGKFIFSATNMVSAMGGSSSGRPGRALRRCRMRRRRPSDPPAARCLARLRRRTGRLPREAQDAVGEPRRAGAGATGRLRGRYSYGRGRGGIAPHPFGDGGRAGEPEAMSGRLLVATLCFAPVLGFAQPAPPPPAPDAIEGWLPRSAAELEVLDKVDAVSRTLTLRVGQSVEVGAMTIALQSCRIRPPDQPEDAAALLAITNTNPEEAGFRGWMLADEPWLGMLQSPVYDVRVLRCRP